MAGAGTAATPPGPGASVGPRARSDQGTWIAWGAVGLVVVIVAVFVIVFATRGNTTNTSYIAITPAPAQIVHDIANVPESTWNKVGVTSSFPVAKPAGAAPASRPMVLDGKTPAMLYYGAEYCPYCAAERWAIATALARFGTWSNLQTTASSLPMSTPAPTR